MRHALFWLLTILVASAATAQTCVAPGKDGPGAISGTVNAYYAPTPDGTYGSATNALALFNRTGAATPIAPGDLVMVIQMQCENIDSSNTNNYGAGNATGRGYTDPVGSCLAGRYEYVRAGPASSNTLLDLSVTPLALSYISDPSTSTNRRTFQIIRVPQYSSASLAGTVTSDPWNGATGGLVAFDVAGNLNLNNGVIDVSGAGFRGAGGAVWDNTAIAGVNYVLATNITQNIGSMKGEGIAGTPRLVYNAATNAVVDLGTAWGGYASGDQSVGAPGNAGGGGQNLNGGRDNGGGGGGGNGGVGGFGAYGWKSSDWAGTFTVADFDLRGIGGASFAQAAANRLAMGGGGGAGANNNSAAVTSSGGAGGGIVLVRTGSASGNGTIDANGSIGQTQIANDSGGGGGAGGSVVFVSANGSVGGLTVNAVGGAGGNGFAPGATAHAGGGGGAGGVVAISAAATVNVSGAANGITNAGNNPINGTAHGATPGSGGTFAPNIGTPPDGASSGAVCLPQLTVSKATTTPQVIVPAGTTASYTITVRNAATAGAAYGVAVFDALPAPFGLQTVVGAATTTFSGTGTTGPGPTTTNSSGTTPTAVFGVAGSANNPTTPSFTLFAGGVVTLSFVVNVNTSTLATFQNSATVQFTDPTRTTGGAATASATINPAVSPGGAYANGATVGGSNYASGSSTLEDVTLINPSTVLTIAKTNGVISLISGQTTSYTVTIANLGPTNAPGAVLKDPAAAGLNCTTVTCVVTAGTASCPSPLTIGALQGAGLTIAPTFNAGSTLSFVVTCGVTATGQ